MNRTIIGYLFLLLGVFGFSIKSVFIKLAYQYQVDTVPLLTLRMLFSLPFYMVIFVCVFQKNKGNLEQKRNRVYDYLLFGVCSLGYYSASITDMYSLEYISVSLERIILFTFPLFALLFSVLLLKKRYSYNVLVPFFICFIGITITFVFTIFENELMQPILVGGGLALVSAISYALYFVFSEKAVSRVSSVYFNSLFMMIACTFAILQYLIQYPIADIFSRNYAVYIIAILLAVFSTVLPSFFIMYSIKNIGASTTALFNNLGPLVTIFLGYMILRESVSMGEILGFIIVIFGVVILRKCK